MCFQNNGKQLEKMRARKRRIKVWKVAKIDVNTGAVTTSIDGHKVVWEKGKVTPHRIREPLKDKSYASAGLYFNTKPGVLYVGTHGIEIEAWVNPEDVIAVSDPERCNRGKNIVLCVVAATVINDPNPNRNKMRSSFLAYKIRYAQEEAKRWEEEVKKWEEKREDREECLEGMREELLELKKEELLELKKEELLELKKENDNGNISVPKNR